MVSGAKPQQNFCLRLCLRISSILGHFVVNSNIWLLIDVKIKPSKLLKLQQYTNEHQRTVWLRTVISRIVSGAKPQQNFENYVWECWANWSTFFSDVWLLMLSKSNIWGYLSNICISEGEGTWVKVPCDWGMQYLGWGLGRSPSKILKTF